MDRSDWELAQTIDLQERAHIAGLLKNDAIAKAAASAYKARKVEPAKTYGSAIWWVASGVLLILSAIAVQVMA